VSEDAFQKPVENSVPRINDEVAVGEDLDFQRRWWKFEGVMWWVFAFILLADLAGALGRGPLAHAHLSNRSMEVKYERIERAGTPSILQVRFASGAPIGDKAKLFVSQSVVDELGAQRIIPAPFESAVGDGGVTYTFPRTGPDASIEFALQPERAGLYHFGIGIAGEPLLKARVAVVP
jgi:hypothetical protein